MVKTEKDRIIIIIVKNYEKALEGCYALLSGTGHDFIAKWGKNNSDVTCTSAARKV